MTFDSRWKNPTGSGLQQLYTWAQDLIKELRRGQYLGGLTEGVSDIQATLGVKANVNQVASGHWLLEAPEDKTYVIIQKAARPFTIAETTTRCTAGTATVTITINGTNLGGSANSASTTEQSQSHSSANEVAVGDTVAIVVSSTSNCEMLSVSIAGTVTLDP